MLSVGAVKAVPVGVGIPWGAAPRTEAAGASWGLIGGAGPRPSATSALVWSVSLFGSVALASAIVTSLNTEVPTHTLYELSSTFRRLFVPLATLDFDHELGVVLVLDSLLSLLELLPAVGA